MSKAPVKAIAALGAGVIALASPFVIDHEGWRNDPYKDGAGIWTVGVGHTGGVEQRRYTDSEVRALLTKDLEKHAEQIRPCVPPSTPVESQVAFLSLAFNVGAANFCASTAAKRLAAGDLKGACEAILPWHKLRDPKTKKLVVSRGLQIRRADEYRLCLKGIA